MAEQELKNAIQKIREYAKESLWDAYFKDIYPKVERNPEDVRFTEQLRLSDYYLKLLKFAQEQVEAAFTKDGVKWPGLVWEEHVNEKVQQPGFHYCTVQKQTDSDGSGQKELPPPDVNLDKMVLQGAGASAAVLLVGGIGKLAGGKVAAISTAGTVLMLIGAAGLVCCFIVGVAGSEKGKAEVAKNERKNSVQVDLKQLLESQAEINMEVIDKWLDDLADYARHAEDIAERV